MSVKDYEFESIIDENDISIFVSKLFSRYKNNLVFTSQIEEEIKSTIAFYCDNLLKKEVVTDKGFSESLKKLILNSFRLS